jgi:tetrapyrrole methylase family protein/MazG family protein
VPRIIVVGLGPGDPQLRTLGTQRALDEAQRIILRTRVHPGIDDLRDDVRVSDCDDLYDRAEEFDSLYSAIADRVIATARESGAVVFAVPGHPRVGERSVPLVASRARDAGYSVRVLDAVSFVDSVLNLAEIEPFAAGLQIIDGEEMALAVDAEPFAAGQIGLDPKRTVLVGQIYNQPLASAVKLGLGRVFPDHHRVLVVTSAGVPGEATVHEVPLYEIDRIEVDHLTSVVVPPLAQLDAVRSPDALTRIVARLRAPGGCPWDRAQTHATLRDPILDEAHETVDAIDTEDVDGLAEELGDLLLLVTMHSQLAEEEGTFRLEDVYEGISRKLVRRHPHVFGDGQATTPDAVVATWEGVEAAERALSGVPTNGDHPIDRLPRSMPSLRKAAAVLAPRSVLSAPPDDGSGASLLAAADDLIQRGIDPERALERALRAAFEARPAPPATTSLNSTSDEHRGEGSA